MLKLPGYRRACRAVTFFLAAYFAGGIATLLLPAGEVFPLYSWFLFAVVPQNASHYELILYEINEKPIVPPRRYQETNGLVSSPHSIVVYQLTQKIGATNDSQARVILKQNWLPPGTRYEIVRAKRPLP